MDSSSSNAPEELKDLDRRVSLRKCSQLIGKSYPTTMKMVNEGKIQSIRIGFQHSIALSEIRRFLQYGNYVKPTE